MIVMLNNKKQGMALMVVICVASVLFVLGVSYLKSVSETPITSKIQINKIQTDYFAKGIQNIALFKIKRYPDFFIRSYRMEMHQERLDKGEAVSNFLVPLNERRPFTVYFVNDGGNVSGLEGLGGPLCNYHLTGASRSDFVKDSGIDSYATEINLLSSDDFNNSVLEVIVRVKHKKSNIVYPYKLTVGAEQVVDKKSVSGDK